MWFLIGMMVGSSMGDSPAHRVPSFSAVPFRCFAALDEGDDAYKGCRRLSLTYEMYQQFANAPDSVSGVDRNTFKVKVDEALTFELRALRTIEKHKVDQR